MGRHRTSATMLAHRPALQLIATGVTAAVLLGTGAGLAAADPETGQGGVTDGATGGQGGGQGGVTDTAPTAPAPAPAPSPEPGPVSPGSPGIIAAPPSGPTTYTPSTYYPPTNYPSTYNPIPSAPVHPPTPVPDVPRQQWKPNTLTIGNIVVPVKKLPKQLQDNPRLIVSANDWAAYSASQIARGLISIGIPKEEATRQAAAAVIGAVAGGAIFGAVAFTATAVTVGIVTIPIAALAGTAIGAGIGSLVPPQPVNIGTGALIGLGAGTATGVAITAASAAAAGLAGAALGATLGGLLTWALGTGDPGKNLQAPASPLAPGEVTPPAPLPNPGGNQFELAYGVTRPDGGASLTYDVHNDGDVSGEVSLGGQSVHYGWSGEQANQVYNALGPAGAAVKQGVSNAAISVSHQVERAVPGLKVTLPQLVPPAHPAAAHR